LVSKADPPSPHEGVTPDYVPSLPNIVSTFATLPFKTLDASLFPVMDNKVDTLTQLQMLKLPDAQQFIESQPKEIKGLLDMVVFEFHPMSAKPREARLLSSIWSYHCTEPCWRDLEIQVQNLRGWFSTGLWEGLLGKLCAPLVVFHFRPKAVPS
jgi:hypothetical protein